MKTSPSSNCTGVSAEFSKFAGERFTTVMLRFDEVIIGVIILAQKSLQRSSLSATNRRRQDSWPFPFNKLRKFGHSNPTTFATVIRERFRTSGQLCINIKLILCRCPK